MAEDGQLERFAAEAEPSLEELIDPIALEARLSEARARRAKVLAQRAAERALGHDPMDTPEGTRSDDGETHAWQAFRSSPPPPTPLPASFEPGFAETAQQPPQDSHPPLARQPAVPDRRASAKDDGTRLGTGGPAVARADGTSEAAARRRSPPAALLFVAGLGLGAAGVAVFLQQSAPIPVQQLPAPVAGVETPPAIAALPQTTDGFATRQDSAIASSILVTSVALPAGLAEPESDPAPPRMMAPGPAIGDLIAAADTDAGMANAAAAAATPEDTTEPAEIVTAAVRAANPETEQPAFTGSTLPERVSILYPDSAEPLAVAARQALEAAGVPVVEALPVSYIIGRSNVRFYHEQDQAGAEGASALLAGELDGEPETRDFTDYPTPTASGRVELWLAGQPSGGTAAPSQPAAPTPAPPPPTAVAQAPEPDPYIPLGAVDQVREVQRFLIERLGGGG